MSAVKDEYRTLRRNREHHEMEKKLQYYPEGQELLSPEFDQYALSIGPETELLREVIDAKEELHIIKRMLEQQERVVDKGLRQMASKEKDAKHKDSEAIRKFNGLIQSSTSLYSKIPLPECRENHDRNTDRIHATIQNNSRSVNSILQRADEVCDGVCIPPTHVIASTNSPSSKLCWISNKRKQIFWKLALLGKRLKIVRSSRK